MKIIRYSFRFFMICFILTLTTLTQAEEKSNFLTSAEMAREIEPFIDDDTALVCYVNLQECKKLPNFAPLLGELLLPEELDIGIRESLSSGKQTLGRTSVVVDKVTPLEVLIEQGVTHYYTILNMKDIKFGPYLIFPDVKEDSSKARAIQQHFGRPEESVPETPEKWWIVYAHNAMIMVGHPILYRLQSYYHTWTENVSYISEQAHLMFVPAPLKTLNGFYGLTPEQKQLYLNKRFASFRPTQPKGLREAFSRFDDNDCVKMAFLFPDSVIAWELSHLKSMSDTVNDVSFDFLKRSRTYLTYTVNMNKPQIQLVCQSTPEDVEKLKTLLDNVYAEILGNHLSYLESMVPVESRKNFNIGVDGSWTKEQKIALLRKLMPRVEGDKLVLTINMDFAKNLWPKILKDVLLESPCPAPVQTCPCPKDVRLPENAGRNAESGAKMSGEIDDSHCMNDEPPK